MKIKFLGIHNVRSKNTRLISLLIDNIIAVDAGSICSALSFEEQQKIQALFITHGHYDHMMELPAFAFNNTNRVTSLYATSTTFEMLESHLIDGKIYPNFSQSTSFLGRPTLDLHIIRPLEAVEVEGYHILPVPVDHFVDSTGFEISVKNGTSILFTGDTGTGISQSWQYVNPDILIIDVTFPNRLADIASNSGHLCPGLLKQQLLEFREMKGYLPVVFPVHLSPQYEDEIKKDMEAVAREIFISIAYGDEKGEFDL
jgi:ribonuclease BN (tRNA processing enzyme)